MNIELFKNRLNESKIKIDSLKSVLKIDTLPPPLPAWSRKFDFGGPWPPLRAPGWLKHLGSFFISFSGFFTGFSWVFIKEIQNKKRKNQEKTQKHTPRHGTAAGGKAAGGPVYIFDVFIFFCFFIFIWISLIETYKTCIVVLLFIK